MLKYKKLENLITRFLLKGLYRPLNIMSFYYKTLFIYQNLLKCYELSVNTIFEICTQVTW